MAEQSYIWDTGGGGDQSPHSEAISANLFKAIMFATSANKGVIPGMLNQLACTVSGGNILTNTGYAIVDGHPYYNDSSKSTAIATPSVGTTGGRIVLRASWSAQTVRITEIRNTDGNAAIPNMTQTPGTTYDIPLCSFTITTGGVITITADTREYAGSSLYESAQLQYRAGATGRRLVMWATPTFTTVTGGEWNPLGIGAAILPGTSGTISVASISGEPSIQFNHNAAESSGLGANAGILAPNKSPRMLTRVTPAGSHANLQVWLAGFVSSLSATASGAYLRCTTTGNLFFVTRQGGSETTTDLGARPTNPVSYEIYTDDAGVTWKCRNTTTGVEVASHTSNVPTAATALFVFGYAASMTGAGSAGQWLYTYVDAILAN